MSAFSAKLINAIKRTPLPDLFLSALERQRGIAYPSRLIGRRNMPVTAPSQLGVLVFAAHPDDETLGLGLTLIRHRTNGDRVTVVFTTNGDGGKKTDGRMSRESRSAKRFSESCDALGLIGIPSSSIINLGFPDGGLRRHMLEAAEDIAFLLEKCRPQTVYVHAIEGGHRDHDVTSFLVQHVSSRLGFGNVYEWAEYNRDFPLGYPISDARFVPDPYVADLPSWRISSTDAEHNIKQRMLEKYASEANRVREYPFRDEILRKASPIYLPQRLGDFSNFSKATLRYHGVSRLMKSYHRRPPDVPPP